MNLAMAGVMHPKTSCASITWNWLSCNLGDWMTIIVSAYQRWIIREFDSAVYLGLARRIHSRSFGSHFQSGMFRRLSPVRMNPSLVARRCEL